MKNTIILGILLLVTIVVAQPPLKVLTNITTRYVNQVELIICDHRVASINFKCNLEYGKIDLNVEIETAKLKKKCNLVLSLDKKQNTAANLEKDCINKLKEIHEYKERWQNTIAKVCYKTFLDSIGDCPNSKLKILTNDDNKKPLLVYNQPIVTEVHKPILTLQRPATITISGARPQKPLHIFNKPEEIEEDKDDKEEHKPVSSVTGSLYNYIFGINRDLLFKPENLSLDDQLVIQKPLLTQSITVLKPKPIHVSKPKPVYSELPEFDDDDDDEEFELGLVGKPKPIHVLKPKPIHVWKPKPVSVVKPKPRPVYSAKPEFDDDDEEESEPGFVGKPKPIYVWKPKPIHVLKPKPIHVWKPKPVSVVKPKPRPVYSAKPELDDDDEDEESKPGLVGKPKPIYVWKPKPIHVGKPMPVHIQRSEIGELKTQLLINYIFYKLEGETGFIARYNLYPFINFLFRENHEHIEELTLQRILEEIISFSPKPIHVIPIKLNPIPSKPIVSEPIKAKPVVSRPILFDPIKTKPVPLVPIVFKPSSVKPIIDMPMLGKPAVVKPVGLKPSPADPFDISFIFRMADELVKPGLQNTELMKIPDLRPEVQNRNYYYENEAQETKSAHSVDLKENAFQENNNLNKENVLTKAINTNYEFKDKNGNNLKK